MSASEPPQDPNAWNPDDTSAVPVGPEPEPTGAGGSGGPGGWGNARVEPFAGDRLVRHHHLVYEGASADS